MINPFRRCFEHWHTTSDSEHHSWFDSSRNCVGSHQDHLCVATLHAHLVHGCQVRWMLHTDHGVGSCTTVLAFAPGCSQLHHGVGNGIMVWRLASQLWPLAPWCCHTHHGVDHCPTVLATPHAHVVHGCPACCMHHTG